MLLKQYSALKNLLEHRPVHLEKKIHLAPDRKQTIFRGWL